LQSDFFFLPNIVLTSYYSKVTLVIISFAEIIKLYKKSI